MNRPLRLGLLTLAAGLLGWAARAADRPNVVYIMADELGYFEPGFMGGRTIQTPNLDRMAAEGLTFANMFAGSSVCAPTRCCLMTGKHGGHASVRANGGGTPLRADEETMASVLKQRGYATGGFGKWGCGGRGSTGVPERHGFDVFLGYYDQVHAHTYYPPYLVRNSEEVPLPGNNGGPNGNTYSQYVIHDAALKFIRDHRAGPFFAYLPYTPPHGTFSIPDSDPAWAAYKDMPWPEEARRYAAMVAMLDRQVGEVLALLRELGIDKDTLVMFSGDNGGADYFTSPDHPRGVHSANRNPATGLEYRGTKGTLYEGGVRVPFVARWPGKIATGGKTDLLAYFPDVLPTVAEVAGTKPTVDVDGVSLLPTLVGESAAGRGQERHDHLYWEIGGWTAVRQGNWRAVKPAGGKPWELYDVAADPGESKNLAASRPEVLARLTALAAAAHQPAREGTFANTDLHERDRRAKYGVHDDPSYLATPSGVKKKPVPGAAASPDKLRVYHFGNSLTGNTMPAWHPALGRSAGKTWENHAWLGAGWQLVMHREQIGAGKDLFDPGSKGDLTLDPGLARSANDHVKAFHDGTWDAVVLQLFSPSLAYETDEAFGKKLGRRKDVGDLACAADLIALQLKRNPDSRVFVYQVWPPMDAGEPRDGQRGAEFPRREQFDYAARWGQPYDPKADRAKTGFPWRSRSFSDQVFIGLKEKYPDLWKQDRLRMVPAGDLFLALDRKFRAGAAPGVADVRDFYTDVQHIRAGLPRYAVAALMYACLFGESPAKLDWALYTDAAKYGPDPYHDAGELLPITADRANLVHQTIDELLATHPHARNRGNR